MAIGQQRCSGLHIGPDEGFEGSGGLIRNCGQANTTRPRIQVSCSVRRGFAWLAPRSTTATAPAIGRASPSSARPKTILSTAISSGFERCITVPAVIRGLTTAGEAFVGVRPAPQHRRPPAAANRAHEALRPAPLKQECRTTRLVREICLEFAQTARAPLQGPHRVRPDRRTREATIPHIITLGQRDKPLAISR
jgi:hypothetical protein